VANDPQDFEQIIAGLDFDPDAGELLDANAELLAAEQVAAEIARPAEPADEDRDESGDEFYRQVAPVELPDQRRWAALAALAAGPVVLLGAALLSRTLPAVLTAAAVLSSAGALVYLILTRPQDPDTDAVQSDDGSAI